MHRIRWAVLLIVAGLLAACQANPPTVVYVVVTSTPEQASVPSSSEAAPQPTVQTATARPQPTSTPPPVATLNLPTLTPDPFPTQTVAQVQVAEQVYENGRMMWIQPVSEIWVMVDDTGNGGAWLRYEDTFIEGEDLETDPSLTPPPERYQPERGFGKLWRENDNVRDALGWAVTPELGYISQYEYRPGGAIEDGVFIAGDGEHTLFSLYGEPFLFHENTQTWELGS
jgi:hypothetical protein